MWQGLSSIQETVQSKSPEPLVNLNRSNTQINDQSAGRESPSTSTAKSSRRDSLSEKTSVSGGGGGSQQQLQQQQQSQPPQQIITQPFIENHITNLNSTILDLPIDKIDCEVNRLSNGTGGGELFEKFRLQKQNKENIIATNGDRWV